MGGLDGEFLIKDITLYDFDGNEILVETDEEIPPETDEGSSDTSGEDSVGGTTDTASPTDDPTSATGSKKSGGCGSFGVGGITLGALVAAGAVLGISKKKRE